jgi:hypothetical protein
MTRTLHWMHIERPRAVEQRARSERAEILGFVEEAPYLRRAEPSLWARLFGARPTLELTAPFDAAGRDALGLFDDRTAVLDGEDDPLGSIRRASGRVVSLSPREPGDDVVLRDLWLDASRLLDSIHFALETPGLAPIAIAFAQMPLVIGVPRARTLEAHVADLRHPALSRALTNVSSRDAGRALEIREGDTLEVLGQTWDPDRCDRRFDLAGRTASYREREQPIQLVLGDAPGLRMVIRAT